MKGHCLKDMPKNKKGGKKGRRGKNTDIDTVKHITYKEDGQEYAKVTKMLGNGRLLAKLADDKLSSEKICIIRGKMRKRVWINTGDIILVSLRDFQDNKCDVIEKYDNNQEKVIEN